MDAISFASSHSNNHKDNIGLKNMVKIILPKRKFSSEGSFVLYDWQDSEKHYMRDFEARVWMFIKDKNPRKVLDNLFIHPMQGFEFMADMEGELITEGKISNSKYGFLFQSYGGSRFPNSLDWSSHESPIKRDKHISDLENESKALKYFAKYID